MDLAYFCELIAVWEKDGYDSAPTKEVLDLEGIDVWIVSRFVVIEHQVNDVGLGSKKKDLEGSVPQRSGGQRPEDICENPSVS